MSKRSIEQLRDELRQIDDDLARLSERERESEYGLGELSLEARRGNKQAAAKLDKYDAFCAEAMAARRRLKAARGGVEAELATALALERSEETKAKAREAKKILAAFCQRGSEIDAGLRKLLENYAGIQTDMATLAGLGVTRVNPELVKVNCKRVMRSALIPIRQDLEMALVPPLERRTFSDLVGAWSGNVEQTIRAILDDEPKEVSAPAGSPAPSAAAERAQAGAA